MTKKILTTEDSDMFRQAAGKVRAVKNDKLLLPKSKPKPMPKPRTIDMEDRLLDYAVSDVEKLGIEDTLIFSVPGLQKNIFTKLRKGHFGLDAELDLHGLNSDEAKKQLLYFLHRCVEDGCRCVLIVHGKGFRSADNHPVLKNNLNKWLRQHKDVQAFCSAAPKDGGAGAVLVLLQISEKYRREAGEY